MHSMYCEYCKVHHIHQQQQVEHKINSLNSLQLYKTTDVCKNFTEHLNSIENFSTSNAYAMNASNNLAYSEQFVQCNNNLMDNKCINCNGLHGAVNKMNGVNIDVHLNATVRHCQLTVTSPNETVGCAPTLWYKQCAKINTARQSSHRISSNLNTHQKIPHSFNKIGFATMCDSDERIQQNTNDAFALNCSVKTNSAHLSNYQMKRNAHRWPFVASTNCTHVLFICVALLTFGIKSTLADTSTTNITTKTITSINGTIHNSTGICRSKDIRNSASNLLSLRNCRVIEGFLMITLIDKYMESEYTNLSFPELTEITEFFLLFRVNGMKSLGTLFPNLRVIRGNVLMQNYAFIVFEMMHLKEIGLHSLTQITRGSVRIEKNPVLCFTKTIDWSLITLNSKDNVFTLNKVNNECPTCPGGGKNEHNAKNENNEIDTLNCPLNVERLRLCWNRKQCQRVCPEICGNRTCNSKGECCDESCIGCKDNNTTECLTCRYLDVGVGGKTKCVRACPNDTFEYQKRRCVTAAECRSFPKPVFINYDFPMHNQPYIPTYEGKCSFDCPPNYYSHGESGARNCVKCDGSCIKQCPPGSIDSLATAQRYLGCTHILGSLMINIRNQGDKNTVKELETFLGNIEEIHGQLAIVRSPSLLSLGFFTKLKKIGRLLDPKEKYALRVIENQNLQALFNTNQTVIVLRGRIFFHLNAKLCMNIIEAFKENVVDLRNESKLLIDEVAPNSNGDKIACNVTGLDVKISKIYPNHVIMKLKPLPYEDERKLLGYLLYYKPAEFRNVTMFDGRDACYVDEWQVDDIVDRNRNSTLIDIIMTHLKPYTQYAYYIITYTVASEQRGGITNISYFQTSPSTPDPVTKLHAVAHNSSEIMVQWGPPLHPNGKLNKYIIKCTIFMDDPKILDQRNYCNEPVGSEQYPILIEKNEAKKEKESTPDLDIKCACEKNEKEHLLSQSDAEQLIKFEDELHNTVYVRQENARRRRDLAWNMYLNTTENFLRGHLLYKRSVNTTTNEQEVFPISIDSPKKKTSNDDTESKLDATNRYYTYFYAEVNASVNSLSLKKLKHFTHYVISVKACREELNNTSGIYYSFSDSCSNEVIAYQQTLPIENADLVTDVKVEKISSSNHSTGVRLKWKAPESPNGFIVSYNIKYQRVDIEHTSVTENCITAKYYEEMGRSYIIPELTNSNGNYSFSVVANTLYDSKKIWSEPVYIVINNIILTPGVIALMIVMIIVLLSCVGAIFWFYKRKYGPPDSGLKLIASVNPEYVSMQYTPDEWEIPREKIIQLNELGQGSFGMVYEGILLNLDRDHDRIRCAIKTVNENATDRERINFLKEAGVMKAFDTHHVVRLLGVVSRGQPVLVIMELMVNGDLKGYLRSHRPESGNNSPQPPTLRRILQMAIEIADGMAYLSAKKFVHRDLAARNCMVAEDLTVKIGDFGMTRDIYETDYYRKGTKGLLPVRWMAPESLKDGVFSSCSDVFSFGIVLWEMATLASQPYQGLSNDQVLRYVIDGGVMERPENCPEKLYSLMCKTWQHRPTARPSFMQIVSILAEDASPNFARVSFYHSHAGQELLQLPQHQLLEVVDVQTPLRAEEENFSVGADDEDDNDPNSFLMDKRNISQPSGSASGPSSSPLR